MTTPSSHRSERAQVRRAPKISVFLVLGAAVGILAAMILTFVFDGTDEASRNTGFEYSSLQVFGFLALIGIALGMVLGGLIALLIDRRSRRRTREVTVEHETVTPDEA